MREPVPQERETTEDRFIKKELRELVHAPYEIMVGVCTVR